MWLALPAGCLAVAMALHAALCRSGWRVDFVMSSLAAGIPLGAALLAGLITVHASPVECAAALLLYAFAFELYIFLFTMVSSSVSAALLLRLAREDLDAAQIEGDYSSRSMVEGRMEKLLRTGLLRREGGFLVVTPKSRGLLTAFRALRQFFRHPDTAAKGTQP